MSTSKPASRKFDFTEALRSDADSVALVLMSAVCAGIAAWVWELGGLQTLAVFGSCLIGISFLFSSLGLSTKISIYLGSLFLKQLPEREIQSRIDRVNELVLGWYLASDNPTDRVVTVMPYTRYHPLIPQLKIKITMSYYGGNKEIEGLDADEAFNRALREIIMPPGTSIFQLLSLDITNPFGDRLYNDKYKRQTIPLYEMSNHKRLPAVASYQKFRASLAHPDGV